MQKSHAIGLALYSYANDNDQMYPDGSSSTEAFQKLLDGGYITDPAILYIPMPGKAPAKPGQKLKPENVCWDLTAPAGAGLTMSFPLLFMTGYRVEYIPGGAAVPLTKTAPQYEVEVPRTFFQKLCGMPKFELEPVAGIASFYINNSCAFHPAASADGTIHNFIPPDFQPDGKTYRQLTPDGVLR